jgi:hypothetical protein
VLEEEIEEAAGLEDGDGFTTYENCFMFLFSYSHSGGNLFAGIPFCIVAYFLIVGVFSFFGCGIGRFAWLERRHCFGVFETSLKIHN